MKVFFKKALLTQLFFVVTFNTYAVSVRDFWMNIPDSVMNGNVYKLRSVVDTLTDDFIQVTHSSHSSLQIKRLPSQTGDSLFCLVRTYGLEAKESEIALYRSDYSLIRSLDFKTGDIIMKPADMDAPCFEKLMGKFVLSLVNASLSADDDTMILRVDIPFLFKEEKKELEVLDMQRIVKWNKETFK